MMTVAIAGATGVVGRRALYHLAHHPRVSRVVAVGRRSTEEHYPKLTDCVVNIQSAEEIAAALPEKVDLAFCCLGTTIKKAGSKAAFREVDRDAVLAFAQGALARGARHFLLVSSLGADPLSSLFYLRTKGQAEEGLCRLSYERLTFARPSVIDDEGARPEARVGERVGLWAGKALFGAVNPEHRYAPISADAIARALLVLAFEPRDERVRIVPSELLQRLAG